MSAPAFFRKEVGGLRPIGEVAQEIVRRIALNQIVRADIRRPRNMKLHAKLWVMLTIVAENLPGQWVAEDVLDVVKMRLGHVRQIPTAKGVITLPGSISLASMPGDEFERFYERAVQCVIAEVIPGLKGADLAAEVEAKLKEFGE